MRFVYDDGGRFRSGRTRRDKMGDCFTRAVSIAGEFDYGATHEKASFFCKLFGKDADYGVPTFGIGRWMKRHGFRKMENPPCDLDDSTFEEGRYVVFSEVVGRKVFGIIPMGHAFAVVDGEVRDSFDPRAFGIEIKEVWERTNDVTR
jgi:hypothetical protein